MASHSHSHGHGHDHAHDHGHEPTFSAVPLDPGAESLNRALRAGFNVLRIVMIVLLVAYFFSGWFQVNPGEQGLIVRFGHLRENAADHSFVFGPGSHASLPDPFDTKIRLTGTVNSLEVTSFSFPRTPDQIKTGQPLAAIAPQLEMLAPADYGTMFSGDRNLSHGIFRIDYQIKNGEDFVRNVGETKEDFE